MNENSEQLDTVGSIDTDRSSERLSSNALLKSIEFRMTNGFADIHNIAILCGQQSIKGGGGIIIRSSAIKNAYNSQHRKEQKSAKTRKIGNAELVQFGWASYYDNLNKIIINPAVFECETGQPDNPDYDDCVQRHLTTS